MEGLPPLEGSDRLSAISYQPYPQERPGERRFSPRDIVRSSIGPDDQYCVGYTGHGGYCLALVMGIGMVKETFRQSGSQSLDAVVAYDGAEVDEAYIGQINMITVSSFCGPQGVIWGHDVARNGISFPLPLDQDELSEFGGVTVTSGEKLREASRMLFGTRHKRHFPLLPGSHVPCAAKYRHYRGPSALYAAAAIGIPRDRSRSACLLMEDVGVCPSEELADGGLKARKRLAINMIRSVLRIGENHGVFYGEVIVDVMLREVEKGNIGCALVAAPYFHLARNGYDRDLPRMSLQQWYGMKRRKFLDEYEESDLEIIWEMEDLPLQAWGSLK
jgi:histidine decarboxylase